MVSNRATIPYHPGAVKFFKEKGAFLRTTQDLVSNSLPLMGLPNEQVAKNRAILEGFWGHDQIRANVDNLLARVRADE